MPTDKPRVTITMSEDQFARIEDYRFGHKMKNQTQAILSLIQKGFSELARESGVQAPDLTDKLSKDEAEVIDGYRNLNTEGKRNLRLQLKMHLQTFPRRDIIELPISARGGKDGANTLRLTPEQYEALRNAPKIKSDDEI